MTEEQIGHEVSYEAERVHVKAGSIEVVLDGRVGGHIIVDGVKMTNWSDITVTSILGEVPIVNVKFVCMTKAEIPERTPAEEED